MNRGLARAGRRDFKIEDTRQISVGGDGGFWR